MVKQFYVTEQENRTNSVLLTGLEFNCTVRDFLCPSHSIPIDLNVIRNWVQFIVMINKVSTNMIYNVYNAINNA